ncbi:hypothetical protein O181_011648 [Austropuccinia psidii MF-1]|uniref:Uncharacterized protein n=1 Tax=Austropuccinia psidii MF-1 TaxID=1389203 RepID=A0A9Q3BV96_9BASI|nr:hypothetical protein [Austropuccinia psidii MF-1]
MIKCPTHSPITASKMSNCAIITLEGESALTHQPPHGRMHTLLHMHTPPHGRKHTHTLPHPWYCAAGSTSVIRKMTIPRRRSPFMDDLVRSNPPSTSRLTEGPL